MFKHLYSKISGRLNGMRVGDRKQGIKLLITNVGLTGLHSIV